MHQFPRLNQKYCKNSINTFKHSSELVIYFRTKIILQTGFSRQKKVYLLPTLFLK